MVESTKSLDKWRHELKSIGKKHWLVFYREIIGVNASSVPRLYKALNSYGEWPLFEAIVSSADKQLTGDPLNYVIAVAHSKWREQQEEIDQESEYDETIKNAVQETEEANKALADKLKKLENS